MRRSLAAAATLVAVSSLVTSPAGAGGAARRGSFVARAVPFPAMQNDIYYPDKGSCLGGVDGVHKVSKAFDPPTPGRLNVGIAGLSGDWDLYVQGKRGEQLGGSENAQVVDGAEGEERVTVPVKQHQRVLMIACNWLGEPEVTVQYNFVAKTDAWSQRAYTEPRSSSGKRTHPVDASGGPVTPLWEWDPSELQISVGDKVLWRNDTGADHHVTPYAGPWKNVDTMHLPIDGKVGFAFDKPGEYLYRCDFAFAGVEHSLLIGDECIGMCGRIVVKKNPSRAAISATESDVEWD